VQDDRVEAVTAAVQRLADWYLDTAFAAYRCSARGAGSGRRI
jgi:hypothetical protein